ncbi:VOC family protein [Mucilaginibacter sp. BJC16-A38]|uniref:VOC family protein n=1 Tax=Mucilaginibacter phenanthrenivorans TaxID=1234842 RepID=UPI0021576ADE|nr:VOC family protein [Mucilaginibacter phenanthrenivorans]MCR8557863.1 VOC family protein [Mucilaginibacter phenanthrenivorans]
MENNPADEFITAIRPTLSVSNGVAAVEFYKKAFNAQELMRVEDPDGAIVAELSINGARFFVADGSPEAEHPTPEKAGSIPIRMGLIVANPDAFAASAIAAGAIEVYPVADQDYGYRLGHIIDPFGHHWEICRPL